MDFTDDERALRWAMNTGPSAFGEHLIPLSTQTIRLPESDWLRFTVDAAALARDPAFQLAGTQARLVMLANATKQSIQSVKILLETRYGAKADFQPTYGVVPGTWYLQADQEAETMIRQAFETGGLPHVVAPVRATPPSRAMER